MTVSEPPNFGWSSCASGWAPKSWVMTSCAAVGLLPAPRPQPASDSATAAASG